MTKRAIRILLLMGLLLIACPILVHADGGGPAPTCDPDTNCRVPH